MREIMDGGHSIPEIVREQREWSGIANFVAVMRESVRHTELQWS